MTDNILKLFSMEGKIVLITGGAHGIGYSLGIAMQQVQRLFLMPDIKRE